jgi:hypothetical protein
MDFEQFRSSVAMDIEEKRREGEAGDCVAQPTHIGYLDSIDSATLTLMAGICLSVPAMIGLSAGEPRPLSPMPLLVVVPAFLVHVGAVLVPVALFFAWNPSLFRGQQTVPRRTYWLLGITALLNVAWFAGGWKWGVEFEGIRYVRIVGIANIIWTTFLVSLFAAFRSRASFKKNLFLHWMLFVWLAWYAFPYLGELP